MIKHNFKYGHPSVKGSPPLVYIYRQMSHDDESTRQRWTQLEFSGENATLECARIKTFFYSMREHLITSSYSVMR